MVLSEYARDASRVSVSSAGHRYLHRQCLTKAQLGSSRPKLLKPVPPICAKKYFMRSRDPESDLVRVVPELRALIEFRRLNFMDADFGLAETPEIIFCRNVIIYFDRPTQDQLLAKA